MSGRDGNAEIYLLRGGAAVWGEPMRLVGGPGREAEGRWRP